MATNTDGILKDIQKRLQEEGEWERIYATLGDELNELGWVDSLYDTAKERSRADPSSFLSFLSENEEASRNSIPPHVKEKIIAMIASAVDKVVQQ